MKLPRHFRFTNDDGDVLVDMRGQDFYVAEPWGTRGPKPNERTIRERIQLLRLGDNDTIMRDVTNLETVLAVASRYHADETLPGWVWFEWANKGEVDKRALVYGGNVGLPGRRMMTPWLAANASKPVLEFGRHRFFEDIEAMQVVATGGTIMTSIGSKLDLTAIKGSAPARLSNILINALTTTVINELWIGLRQTGNGISGFEPLWQLTDGSGLTETTSQADGDASGGTAFEVAYTANDDNQFRCQILISDVAASDQDHFAGRYLVLLRYKLEGSGTEAAVELSSWYNAGSSLWRAGKKYISDTNNKYKMLPLGIVSIPLISGKILTTAAQIAEQAFFIESERLTGGAGDNLWLDTLTIVPADRIIHATIPTGGILSSDNGRIVTFPNDVVAGNTEKPTTLPVEIMDISPTNFFLPHDGGMMVLAGSGDLEQYDTDLLQVTVDLYPRWRTFRRGLEASW